MHKKTKLIFSLITLCFSLAVLCFGVYSAVSVDYTISGSINYEVDDAFVQVETRVYALPFDNTLSFEELTQLATELSLSTLSFEEFETLVTTELNVPNFAATQTFPIYNSLTNSGSPEANDIEINYNNAFVYVIMINVKNLTNENALNVGIQNNIETNSNIYTSPSIVGLTSESNSGKGQNMILAFSLLDPTESIDDVTFSYTLTVGMPAPSQVEQRYLIENSKLLNSYLPELTMQSNGAVQIYGTEVNRVYSEFISSSIDFDIELSNMVDVVGPTLENANDTIYLTVDEVNQVRQGIQEGEITSLNYIIPIYSFYLNGYDNLQFTFEDGYYNTNTLTIPITQTPIFDTLGLAMLRLYFYSCNLLTVSQPFDSAFTIALLQVAEQLNLPNLDSILAGFNLSEVPEPYTSSEEEAFLKLSIQGVDYSNENFMLLANSLNSYDGAIPSNCYFTIKFFYVKPGSTYNLKDYYENKEISFYSIENVDNVILLDDFNLDLEYLIFNNQNYIVEVGNETYASIDGILFNKNNTNLIAYPNAKILSSYKIPDTVKYINSAAFYFSNNLQEIIVNYNFINNLNCFKGTPTTVVVKSDKYISRFEIASWISNSIDVRVEYVDVSSGLTYTEKGNGYYVTSYTPTDKTMVSIPETYQVEGGEVLSVVGIGANAFSNASNLTNIDLPDTLAVIEDNAFSGAVNLEFIDYANATLTSYGQNVFGDRTDVIIYTQNETTKNVIKNATPNSTSTQINISIETEASQEQGNGQQVPHFGTFNLTFTIDDKQFVIETNYNQKNVSSSGLANQFNGFMIISSNQIGEINVAVSTSIDAAPAYSYDLWSGENYNLIDHIQEQVAIAKIEDDGTLTKIAGTADDVTYYNHPGGSANVTYEGTAEVGENLALVVKFTVMTYVQCFTEGTLVTLADGSTKPIEEIGYDDLLLVYDFDRGEFGYSYPIWITSGTYSNYYLMKFDDGSEVEIVLSHRLFDVDGLTYETSIDATYSQIGDRFFRQVLDEDGKPIITTPTCISIERIDEKCTYYNLVTSQSFNFFANGLLGATGAANIYTFEKTEDGRYIHNPEQLQATKYEGNTFTYEDFDSEIIPYEFYLAYRLAETKNMVTILSQIPPYNQYPLEVVYQMAIEVAEAYFEHGYFENMYEWPETFQVTTSDGLTTRVNPRDTFTLPTPQQTEGFIGWYNTFDGKIYQAGEEATIYMNTHLIARYA